MKKKTSQTVEDYLKSLLKLSDFDEELFVPMGTLARYLNLTPGTITTMVKRFVEDGWIEYQSRKGCRLTERGLGLALQQQRKHRLIELFLTDRLMMDIEDVHHEAEVLEHALSDKVLAYMDKFLDFPKEDPHGQPIFRSVEEYRAHRQG
ncbi:MAG: metal-dependent transcriptional regulator [Sphaerochaeta sp.]|nr:metal-dependent transcriptional regulator [Sphaerochaeta sp.]